MGLIDLERVAWGALELWAATDRNDEARYAGILDIFVALKAIDRSRYDGIMAPRMKRPAVAPTLSRAPRRQLSRAPQRPWAERDEAILKELWLLGRTGTEIAVQLGVTRNVVLGKVHRLGLKRRAGTAPVTPADCVDLEGQG